MNITRRQKYTNTGNSRISNTNKIKLNLDMISLNILCSYVLTDNGNVRRAHLINLSNMMSMLDMTDYENDPDRKRKIMFINRALEGKLVCNIKDTDLLIKHVNGGIFSGNEISNESDFIKILSNEELQWVNNTVTESLKYGHMFDYADKFIDICTRLKTGEFGTKETIVKEFESVIGETQSKFRKSKADSFTDMVFSLRSGVCDEAIKDIYEQLVNPSVRLQCGMRGLNDMTGGGFESGRVYMFFGLPGEGKSGLLLNLAYQIKKFNKKYKAKDPTKTPCIVLLTMENTVRETIERLFSMSCHSDDMTAFTIDEVINMLRTEGELVLNDKSPIDIVIKYVPDRSVDTGYLYQLTDDLEDDGYEVICLIQDYVKRIRSTEYFQDLRLELGAIVNEFKTFAAIKDIPVISASQLNRDATKHIDEGRSSGKNDLVRMMGRSNIGESMLMLENVDCSFMIAPEFDRDGNKYMGIQRVKIRYKAKSNYEYIYHPFESPDSMRYLEDVECATPLFKTTLKPEMAGGYGSKSIYHPDMCSKYADMDREGGYIAGGSSLMGMNIDETNNLEIALSNMKQHEANYIPVADQEIKMVAFSPLIQPFFFRNDVQESANALIKPFIIVNK